MKILITGANGFLGKEAVKKLTCQDNIILTTDMHGDMDLVGDLSDINFVNNLPEVDVVVHCAAVQYVSKNLPLLFRKKYFYENNVVATKNLCNKYKASNPHFINVATSMMYKQTGDHAYTTSSAMLGEGVYSKSKLASIKYVNEMPNKTANIIPCIIGGEGREGLFIGFVKMLQKYRVVVFPGKGNHKIHMVHVSDVANLIKIVIEKQAIGNFNAAAPEPLSIQEWITEITGELSISKYMVIKLPLYLISTISYITRHRVIAREQLIMLEKEHVLCINDSLALGWTPQFNNAQIVRDISRHIAR